MGIIEIITSSVITTILVLIILLVTKTWIIERVKLSLQKDLSEFDEELRRENQAREKAEKVAEYMSLARNLREDSGKAEYIRANKLSWELAMWLPEDIYKEMARALSSPDLNTNELSVIILVRKLLLGEKAGDLSQNDIAHHAPGIGKKK
jgi:hypothetical protein